MSSNNSHSSATTATFQELRSHTGLVASELDGADVEQFPDGRKSYWTTLGCRFGLHLQSGREVWGYVERGELRFWIIMAIALCV